MTRRARAQERPDHGSRGGPRDRAHRARGRAHACADLPARDRGAEPPAGARLSSDRRPQCPADPGRELAKESHAREPTREGSGMESS